MYASDLATAKRAILERYPEFADSSFESDDSGWTNYAVKADGKYLFRFPRNEEAYRAINKEYTILKLLNDKLPDNIRVPKYIYSSLESEYPYVGYRLIEGRFLTKDVFSGLSKEERRRTLDCMAEFLNTLHSVDYNVLNLAVTEPKEKYKNFYDKIQKVCFPYFENELKESSKKLFEDFFADPTMHDYVPTLVHGDLSEDHILITENGVGIIDFGDLTVFDPAYDFIWAYLCDFDFYQELIYKYRGNKDAYFEHRIRDFHMIRPPYDGIIYADETGDKELLKKELHNLRDNLEKCRKSVSLFDESLML